MKKYLKGHLLCVKHGLYEHVGISDGKGHVYENAHRTGGRGKVSLKDFSGGKKIIDVGIIPGSVTPDKILENAERLIADPKRYNLLFNNCEHFVREVCGVDINSPQIQQTIFLAVSSTVALKVKDPKIKGAATGASLGAILSKKKGSLIKNSLIGASFGLLIGIALQYRNKLKTKGNKAMKPHIDNTSFGSITIDGQTIEHDIVIRLSGEIVKRKKKLSKSIYGTSHVISLEEAKFVYEHGASYIIVGTGQSGMLTLSKEATEYFKKKKCKIDLEPTPTAIKHWNKTKGPVIGIFHLTC